MWPASSSARSEHDRYGCAVEPHSPITLTFQSPEVERAYCDEAGRAARRSYRILVVLSVPLVLGSWFTYPQVAVTQANLAVVRTLWLCSVLPAEVLAVAFAFTPMAFFQRRLQSVLVMIIASFLAFSLACGAWYPDFDRADIRTALLGNSVVVFGGCVLMRFMNATVVFSAWTLGITVVIVSRSAPSPFIGPLVFWLAAFLALAALLTYLLEKRARLVFASARALAVESARSERLLRNVLPESIAERLKHSPESIADHFEEATVLFADIVGFTELAEQLSPRQLVAGLDELFSAFDELARQHRLEKIKTIGDAYMVVAGVPVPRPDHTQAAAEMALDMRDLIAQRRFINGRQIAIRIGIHSGPVVASVIGKQKFLYDLWGDTVNTASRLESHGVPGEIHVSGETCRTLGPAFEFESRGTVHLKGKGETVMWLLRRRSSAAATLDG